jgi:hypothetical protein
MRFYLQLRAAIGGLRDGQRSFSAFRRAEYAPRPGCQPTAPHFANRLALRAQLTMVCYQVPRADLC